MLNGWLLTCSYWVLGIFGAFVGCMLLYEAWQKVGRPALEKLKTTPKDELGGNAAAAVIFTLVGAAAVVVAIHFTARLFDAMIVLGTAAVAAASHSIGYVLGAISQSIGYIFGAIVVIGIIKAAAEEENKKSAAAAPRGVAPNYMQYQPNQVYGDAELASPDDIHHALQGMAAASSSVMFGD